MYQLVAPLAVSMHAPLACGELHCFSLHNKSINLINQNNEIVTLHRYNYSHNNGLSPMGWLLKANDFDYIYDLIAQGAAIQQQTNDDLCIGDIEFIRHYREITLTIKTKLNLEPTAVKKILSPISTNTGLFGSLGDNITENLPIELTELIQYFICLLKSLTGKLSYKKQLDEKSFTLNIGLGPGLTPSYDDMIVGILAVLHSALKINPKYLSELLNLSMDKLELLTTKVSATFLNYAIRGIFSSSLLAVIHLFRQYELNRRQSEQNRANLLAVNRLLGYGHTSGADLLLGI